MIFLYLLLFVASCAVLVYSGTWIVKFLVKVARFLEWKEFIVASFIMTFVTSLPEFFVALSSSFHNKPLLSLSNIMGSNIIALTLVMGIGGMLAGGLELKEKTLQRSTLYATLIAPLPLFLMLDGHLSRWDGVVLCLVFVFYFHQLVLQEKRYTKPFNNFTDHKKTNKKEKRDFLKNVSMVFLGVCFLLLSSEGVVRSASYLAKALGFPLPLIGLFLVAAGTSGPEIAFGIRSISMGHEEMTLGNTMGSVVMNSTLIIGVVSLLRPFVINDLSPYFIGVGFTVFIASIFLVFVKTDKTISRKEAFFLILLYIVFFLIETGF